MRIKGSLLYNLQGNRPWGKEEQNYKQMRWHSITRQRYVGKGSMHPIPNAWSCPYHIVNTNIWSKAVWGIFLFTFQNVACLLGLSQIIKYSKITHKFLWEFFQHHCKEVEYYFLEEKTCSSKDMMFSQFFYSYFADKNESRGGGAENKRSKRKSCHLQVFRNLHL